MRYHFQAQVIKRLLLLSWVLSLTLALALALAHSLTCSHRSQLPWCGLPYGEVYVTKNYLWPTAQGLGAVNQQPHEWHGTEVSAAQLAP